MPQHKSYTVEYKLKVVEEAEQPSVDTDDDDVIIHQSVLVTQNSVLAYDKNSK